MDFLEIFRVNNPGFSIQSIGSLISAIIGIIIILAGLAAFFNLLFGGFQWILSGGNEDRLNIAKGRISAAIFGLLIVVSSWALMLLIEQFLGIKILSGSIKIPSAY